MRLTTTLPERAITIIPAHEISFDQQADVFREAWSQPTEIDTPGCTTKV
jgi:hypothetical protein